MSVKERKWRKWSCPLRRHGWLTLHTRRFSWHSGRDPREDEYRRSLLASRDTSSSFVSTRVTDHHTTNATVAIGDQLWVTPTCTPSQRPGFWWWWFGPQSRWWVGGQTDSSRLQQTMSIRKNCYIYSVTLTQPLNMLKGFTKTIKKMF